MICTKIGSSCRRNGKINRKLHEIFDSRKMDNCENCAIGKMRQTNVENGPKEKSSKPEHYRPYGILISVPIELKFFLSFACAPTNPNLKEEFKKLIKLFQVTMPSHLTLECPRAFGKSPSGTVSMWIAIFLQILQTSRFLFLF